MMKQNANIYDNNENNYDKMKTIIMIITTILLE